MAFGVVGPSSAIPSEKWPFLRAQIAAWVRFATRIFRRIDFMWTFTVASVTEYMRAIILFE